MAFLFQRLQLQNSFLQTQRSALPSHLLYLSLEENSRASFSVSCKEVIHFI